MVRPADRRKVVMHMMSTQGMSVRRACGLVKIHRSVFEYESKPDSRQEEVDALKKLASRYPRYGCEPLHTMLRREGFVINAQESAFCCIRIRRSKEEMWRNCYQS